MMRNYKVNVFCMVSILELDCFLKTKRQFLRIETLQESVWLQKLRYKSSSLQYLLQIKSKQIKYEKSRAFLLEQDR